MLSRQKEEPDVWNAMCTTSIGYVLDSGEPTMNLVLILAAAALGLEPGAGAADTKPAFHLQLPGDIRLAPGQRRDITISVEEAVGVRKRLQLYFNEMPGVRVVPAHAEIHRNDRATRITLIADADAQPGTRTLEVMGEAPSGRSVLKKVTITVDR
jgi:hypothetical protein